MRFAYPTEKFSAARRRLMLPFPHGEAEAIARAFHECSLGLNDLRDEDLDEDARNWAAELRKLMDTSGLQDPSDRGLWTIKAEQLTEDQMFELSRVVDELAHWFARQSRGDR
jgi:hypothetical protein